MIAAYRIQNKKITKACIGYFSDTSLSFCFGIVTDTYNKGRYTEMPGVSAFLLLFFAKFDSRMNHHATRPLIQLMQTLKIAMNNLILIST